MSSSPPDDDRTVIRPSPGSAAVEPPAASVPIPLASTPESGPSLDSAAPAATGPRPAQDSEAALAIGTYLGEFELTGVLGEGGFGIVYLAQDRSLDRRVAVKEYMPSTLAARGATRQVQVRSERHRETFAAGLKSFVNEAKLLAQFDHPSLVKVYRFWEANGTAYMVMPYYQGVTLKQRLAAMGQPPDEAWLMKLLAPLTEALAVIHAENCYHRDIAPDNVILLASSGRPLLLDFGAARRVIGGMTQALTVILKPGYAPVEQYAEAPEMKQGPWTDVYALAASVYYAIVGRTPPPSVGRLMEDNYVPLAVSCAGRYSDRFLGAIDRALSVRPEARTQSIDALRADLGLPPHRAPTDETRLIVEGSGSVTRTGMQTQQHLASTPAGRPTRLWAGLAAAVLVVAGFGAYWALKPRDATPVASAPATPSSPASSATAILLPAPPVAAEAARPTAAVATPAGFDIQTEFAAAVAARTPGFEVTVSSSRERLRIGHDRLAFKLKSARSGYVTVLAVDSDGSLIQLIPSKEMRGVKIRAGETLSLPPGDVSIVASDPAGAEHFLLLVSTAPRTYDSLGVHNEGGYSVFPAPVELAAARARTAATGLPTLLGQPQGCTSAEAGCNDYGAARFTLDVVR